MEFTAVDWNLLIGGIAISTYLISFILGIACMSMFAESRAMWFAMTAMSFSSVMFLGLFGPYLASRRYELLENDLIWSSVHCISGLGQAVLFSAYIYDAVRRQQEESDA